MRNRLITTALLMASLSIMGCEQLREKTPTSDTQTSPASKVIRKAEKGLSQDVAVLRKKQISHPSYQLKFILNAEGTPFSGESQIQFHFSPQGSDLSLDFHKGEILEVTLNGQIEAYEYNEHFLTFKEDNFKTGKNTLNIKFRHAYNKEGSGLYYFKDPVDQTVYTYSDFEPFSANKLFPLFDQPNLKATFELNADVPAHWQVVSNLREDSVVKNQARANWHFPPSPLMSSYIFALHAGEYASFDLGEFEGIPLRLFSRQSNKEYVPVEEWNTVTRQGFAFFNDFFGIAYPFGKYDQLAVPDFNSGAMENIGAVTFADQYCCVPGERSLARKTFFVNAILHEQAHMWFGNLVTMDWWDDIWLNESFAEFAGYLAFSQGTDFKDPWLENLWARKLWGYRDDDAVSTHPIKFPVENTEYVMAAIDGITYAKGSAVLRQLSYFIGEDKFKQGVQAYMSKYAYQNAKFDNLLQELSTAAGSPMDDWAEDWLLSTGVNRISTELSCTNNKITKLNLVQNSKGKTLKLRPQLIELGLYTASAGKLAAPSIYKVNLQAEHTEITEAIGQTCPVIALPNIGDYGFIKVILDSKSLENLPKYLEQITDPHARALLWVALKDGVTDGRYPATNYFDTVLSQAGKEPNKQILAGIRSALYDIQGWLFKMQDTGIEAVQKQYAKQIAALALKGIQSSDNSSDEFQIWLEMYQDFAYLPEQLAQLKQWHQMNKVEGWTMDQRRRWEFLSILAERQFPGVQALIEAEKENDKSARGHRAYLHASTRTLNSEEKADAFENAIDASNPDSLGNRRTIANSVNTLRQPLTDTKFAQDIIQLSLNNMDTISSDMLLNLTRRNLNRLFTCEKEWSGFIQDQLDSERVKHKDLRNALLESAETNDLCIKAKANLVSRL